MTVLFNRAKAHRLMSKVFCSVMIAMAIVGFNSCEKEDEETPNNDYSNTPPPIENTTQYANAAIKLPENWNGTSVLADGFVWISYWDTKLQDKYNVHPCDDWGNPNCIYHFADDYEIWNDDDNYYEYPLSPNIVIEAGINGDGYPAATRRMTVNEFADYYRNYSSWGIIANVAYENSKITKIIEKYVP